MSHRWIMVGTFAVIGLALVLTFSWGSKLRHSQADGIADEITLTGIVRDFKVEHPDFGVAQAGGAGHVAGLVGEVLPGDGRPHLGTDPKLVETQWLDGEGRPIAPHLANVRGGVSPGETLGVRVNGRIEIGDETSIDAYDSALGVYGSLGNYGGDAVVSTNAIAEKSVRIKKGAVVRGDVLVGPGGSVGRVIENKGRITGRRTAQDEAFEMPELELPHFLEDFVPELDIEGALVWTGDTSGEGEDDDPVDLPAKHFGTLDLEDDATLTIEGELVVRVDGDFKMHKRSEIRLLPGAGLTLFVSGKLEIDDQALINVETGRSSAVAVNAVGSGKLKIDKGSHVYAIVTAPERKLEIKDQGQLYGAFIGQELKLEGKGSGVHVDRANTASGPWNFALTVREKIEIADDSLIDGFDSTMGPYGFGGDDEDGADPVNVMDAIVIVNGKKKDYVKLKDGSVLRGDLLYGPGGERSKIVKIDDDSEITGAVLELAEPAAIPVVTPRPMGASIGDVEFENETVVLSTDMRAKKIKFEKGTIVLIDGDVTVRCEKLEMKESQLRLEPGARLTLYIEKELKLKQSELNANTGDPKLVSIRRIAMGGKGKIKVEEASRLVAWMQGARTELEIKDGSQVFGSFSGRKVKVKKDSAFHVDMAGLVTCIDVQDAAGEFGVPTDGGVESETSFRQWFGTALGINQSKTHAITLTRNTSGVYEYLDEAFYPIDGRLFGNEGQPHNYHFTYAIRGSFTASECGGDFIEFEGGDGAWVFINGRLAVDLGGIRSSQPQRIDLDRLGLEGGRAYPVAILYGQRDPNDPVFRLRTTLEIEMDGIIPSVTNQYD